jgi:hypothetical protein
VITTSAGFAPCSVRAGPCGHDVKVGPDAAAAIRRGSRPGCTAAAIRIFFGVSCKPLSGSRQTSSRQAPRKKPAVTHTAKAPTYLMKIFFGEEPSPLQSSSHPGTGQAFRAPGLSLFGRTCPTAHAPQNRPRHAIRQCRPAGSPVLPVRVERIVQGRRRAVADRIADSARTSGVAAGVAAAASRAERPKCDWRRQLRIRHDCRCGTAALFWRREGRRAAWGAVGPMWAFIQLIPWLATSAKDGRWD